MSKPIIEDEDIGYLSVTEAELDEALVYAAENRQEIRYKRGEKKGRVKRKAYVGQDLSRELLRILGNTALSRRHKQPEAKLALLAANVAREATPQYEGNAHEAQLLYEAYKCAVMKIMSIRRVWQMRNDAKRKAAGVPIPDRPEATAHPLDQRKKHKNQWRLFS